MYFKILVTSNHQIFLIWQAWTWWDNFGQRLLPAGPATFPSSLRVPTLGGAAPRHTVPVLTVCNSRATLGFKPYYNRCHQMQDIFLWSAQKPCKFDRNSPHGQANTASQPGSRWRTFSFLGVLAAEFSLPHSWRPNRMAAISFSE